MNTHPLPYRRLAGLLAVLAALVTTVALVSAPTTQARTATPAAPAAERAGTTAVVGGAMERAGRVTYRLVRHRYRVPFTTRHVKTSQLRRGQTRVAAPGRTGTWVKVYRVKRVDGRVVQRRLVRGFMARKPHARIIKVGTRTAGQGGGGGQQCDPNYRGACVPVASDVDCAGGSGNGPRYVDGPVYVVGDDVYDLDSDGDDVGCES